jgi:hypothetical protein
MIGTYARVFGVLFVLIGILGFVPQLTPDGMLLGLFPVNAVHNIVHILLGLWGLAAGGSAPGAVMYFKSVAVIYTLLMVLGLIPATNTLFGLAPIHGHDVWLHGALAAISAYYGFVRGKAVAVPV